MLASERGWARPQGDAQRLKGATDKGCRVGESRVQRERVGAAAGWREGLYRGDKPVRWWLSCGKSLKLYWIY